MQIRLAKQSDIEQLAQVHWTCSTEQPGGFMFNLGRRFLRQYYRIYLREKHSLILVADEEHGKLLGFHSGTLRAEEHVEALRSSWLSLLISALPAVVRKPSLVREIYSRYRSTARKADSDEYILKSGPRGEFWAWSSAHRDAGQAIHLHETWHAIMRHMGAKAVRSEVDRDNVRILRYARMMGAHVIKEILTPDGRKRLIVEYVLEDYGVHRQRTEDPTLGI